MMRSIRRFLSGKYHLVHADGLLIRHAPDPLYVRYAVVRHV